jgi:hypothetical protein
LSTQPVEYKVWLAGGRFGASVGLDVVRSLGVTTGTRSQLAAPTTTTSDPRIQPANDERRAMGLPACTRGAAADASGSDHERHGNEKDARAGTARGWLRVMKLSLGASILAVGRSLLSSDESKQRRQDPPRSRREIRRLSAAEKLAELLLAPLEVPAGA